MSPHMSEAVPIVRTSQILAIPSQTESPAAWVLASTCLMSIRPPASYTDIQSPPLAPMLEVSPKTYWAACCTKRELPAEQACTHSHIIIATVPSWNANWPAGTPMNSCVVDASVGKFGFWESLSPVRKLSHAAVPRSSPREASTTFMLRRICRFSSGQWLRVIENENERVCGLLK